MKDVLLGNRVSTNCEGVSRRDLVRVGALSFFGLSLPQFFSMRKAMGDAKAALKDRNCILLFMNGGPTHIDTWDPKPEAPAEYRGEFNAIDTNADGVRICEHMPNLA